MERRRAQPQGRRWSKKPSVRAGLCGDCAYRCAFVQLLLHIVNSGHCLVAGILCIRISISDLSPPARVRTTSAAVAPPVLKFHLFRFQYRLVHSKYSILYCNPLTLATRRVVSHCGLLSHYIRSLPLFLFDMLRRDALTLTCA